MNKTSRKKMLSVLLIIAIVWLVLFSVDFLCANSLVKPVFVLPVLTKDDGGSGIYAGLGYWFDLRGNFMPEEEDPGVTDIKGYLFGLCLIDKTR